MKVLVTGIAGFLGSNLLTKLLNEGHYVVGIDNLSMGRIENIESNIKHKNFKFLEKDILENSTFENLNNNFDVIIHLAAFKIPRYGNAVATLITNSKGGENVLEYARSISCKCVLASTSDVYGMNPDLPFV